MAAPYGDGLYANEPPAGYGLNITDLFHIVEPKPGDPGINSKVDSKYPNVAIITHDAANQFGGMWAKEKLDLSMPFYTEIFLHLGHQYGKQGRVADGMTFTLHNDPAGLNAIGGAGEGLGVYKGRKWTGTGQQTTEHGTYLRNSLVIEFDTYKNLRTDGAFVDDPGQTGSAHCALIVPRAETIYTADHRNVDYFIPSQEWVKFEVTWTPDNGGGGILRYSFEGNDRTYTVNNILSTFGGTKVYWGFTGATGQLTSVQAAAIAKLPEQGVAVEKAVKNADGASIDQGIAYPGDILSYTVKVTSQQVFSVIGPVLIEDEISEYVDYVGGNVRVTTSSGETYEVGYTFIENTMIVNTNHTFENEGDWLEITFNVRVNEDAGGKIIYNQAIVKAEGLTEQQESNITRVTVFAEPQKSVSEESKSGQGGSAVTLGDEITYDIVYGNDEPMPATIIIEDALPSGVDFVSATENHMYDDVSHTVTWTLSDVPGETNGKVSMTVRVNEKAVDKIKNYATVKVGGNEPRNTNIVENPVILETLVKKVSESSAAGQGGGTVKAGDDITYEIEYINYKETDATVFITDKLPTGVDFLSATNYGEYDNDTHTVTWTLMEVPGRSDGAVFVTVRVNKKAAVKIVNYAVIQVDEDNPRITTYVENPVKGSHCLKQVSNCRKTIKGKKTWEDNDNEEGTRPPYTEINLLRDGEVYKSATIGSTGDGVYTFSCLPIWKNSENKYHYQIDEATVPDGYTKTIEGFNVKNTLTIRS